MSLNDMSLDYVSSAHMFADLLTERLVTFVRGDEMTSIAWSYAALRHLELDPAIIFHDDGYKGGAASIIENFGVEPYPHMLRWLR
jgi:hypothetical protein